jgi:hypothetical protein
MSKKMRNVVLAEAKNNATATRGGGRGYVVLGVGYRVGGFGSCRGIGGRVTK